MVPKMMMMMMLYHGKGGNIHKIWQTHPNEKLKTEKRSNPWMTHGSLKLMHERGYVHDMARQDNGLKLWSTRIV